MQATVLTTGTRRHGRGALVSRLKGKFGVLCIIGTDRETVYRIERSGTATEFRTVIANFIEGMSYLIIGFQLVVNICKNL